MKKFEQPFDAYELASATPMHIELSTELGYYKELYNNPIYYNHAFQFIRGGLYRAVLGYELVWDKDFEEKLTKALDFLLVWHAERTEYYIEEIIFKHQIKILGLKWKRGVKPELNFSMQYAKWVKAASRATARVNLLDKPHHVDIEFDDGEIYTVSYLRYLRWKKKCIRSLDHENPISRPTTQPEQNGTNPKDAKRSEAGTAEGSGHEDPTRTSYAKLLDLRKAIRRTFSLSKAREKASTNLV